MGLQASLGLTSLKQFADEMRKRGLCLKNAKEYGNKLPVELKKHTVLCVKKEEAKQFKLCKKCLVMIH